MRGEHFAQRTNGGHAAGVQHNHLGGNAPCFRNIVRNIDDAEIHGEQAGKNVVRRGVVEAGEGFVEQKEIGPGRQGSGQGHSLALATGKLGGRLIGECLGAKEVKDFGHARRAELPANMTEPKADVVAYGEVGKQGGLLSDESEGTRTDGDADAVYCVEERSPVDFDTAGFRFYQTGQDAQKSAFPGTGRAKNDRPLIAERELRFE